MSANMSTDSADILGILLLLSWGAQKIKGRIEQNIVFLKFFDAEIKDKREFCKA